MPTFRPDSTRLLAVLALSFLLIGCGQDSFAYRYLFWGPSSIEDCKKFPSKEIKASGKSFRFHSDSASAADFAARFATLEYAFKGAIVSTPLEQLLEASGTTAFIVIRRDTLLAERYLNGYGRDSLQRTFSISKSLVSAALGLAIMDGRIGGPEEPANLYLDWKKLEGIKLDHLLNMSAGFAYTDATFPWTDNVRLYYVPALRKEAQEFHLEAQPGTRFRYNNYSPLMIGMMVEKAAGISFSQYFQDRIWSRIGTEKNASWSVNSAADGLESMGSGFNSTAIDLAKIGRLYLRQGDWDGERILPAEWVRSSTTPDPEPDTNFYPPSFAAQGISYRHYWWCQKVEEDGSAFYASGHLGQVLYVYPKKQLVMVRCGKRRGDIDAGWHQVMRTIARGLE